MKHGKRGTPRLGFLILLSLCAAPAAHAQFIFTKIVDTNTLIPGGAGTFGSFGFGPTLSGGNVAFYGAGSSSQGIYLYSHGTIGVVADTNTSIPNGGGSTFTTFDVPSLSGSTVALYGSGAAATNPGIYTGSGGPLQVVADTTAAIPGGSGNFTGFGLFPSISGNNVAFFGTGSSSQRGIYSNIGGTLGVVADRNTLVPGGTGNFRLFNNPSISGANVAFRGMDAALNPGIYSNIGGTLGVVADTNTLIPNGGGNTFTDFDLFSPSVSGSNIAFRGVGAPGQEGVYDTVGGSLHVIADTNGLIPGTGTLFGAFDTPSLSGNFVAFDGGDGFAGTGIYTDAFGGLIKVIAPGDILDGKTVDNATGAQIDGRQIAFDVTFHDGSQGIYIASVPEADAGLAFIAGALPVGLLVARRRRRGASA